MQVSRKKLEILTVEGNHLSILDNIEVAAAINRETVGDFKDFEQSMEEGKIVSPLTDHQQTSS